METDEMIQILEGLIRDPETNPTAKCTAIRTLLQIDAESKSDPLDDELDRILERNSRGN
jgi:hypothetical protein